MSSHSNFSNRWWFIYDDFIERKKMTNQEDLKKFAVSYPNRMDLFDNFDDAVAHAKRKTARDCDQDVWMVYKPVAYPKPVTPDMEVVTLN